MTGYQELDPVLGWIDMSVRSILEDPKKNVIVLYILATMRSLFNDPTQMADRGKAVLLMCQWL